ncbi:MAG: hypothetical protein IPM82_02450 [Saprospiraceae bacterium]|nr:hypothetical protein [Saprospiraceae bacterium]
MTDNNSTEFKPSFYARVPVQQLTPQEMDSLLANGYYRNGLDACANSVRFMGNAWVSAVMLRVRLSDFVWKKRLRKLLRSNGEKFSFQFQPFEPTAEKEVLWQQFKRDVHGWANVPKLEMHLLRGQPATSFNTWELCVFFESKLVAISVFDRGERGITSLEAAYDTAFNKHSLGVYTMLLEIEHCIEHRLDFYYPGFFPKGDPMFDYKLRPGNLEFFRVESAEWLPLEQLSANDWKLDELAERHRALKLALQEAKIAVTDGFNHCFHRASGKPALTASSLCLIVPASIDKGGKILLFIYWNLWKKGYQAFEGNNIVPTMKPDAVDHLKPIHFYDVQQANYFGTFQTPEEVVFFVQKIKDWVILPA